MGPLKYLALLAVLGTTLVSALPEDAKNRKKAIGIFNIVKFPNEVCISGAANQNGTCYTAEECTSRDGVASGTCADGYGVCCIITISCGSTSAENCTYLTQSASNSPNLDSTDDTRACTYKICPRDSSIRRIRFDLTTFAIAGPVAIDLAGMFAAGAVDDVLGNPIAGGATLGPSVGQCHTDTFSISGTRGPYPTICGMNSGQHMIVDTDGTTCVTASFSFGLETSSRSYTIHALQYAEGHTMAGDPGCLQYYTGDMGTVSTFNWQGRADRFTSVHLANQDYNVCVRNNVGSCRICWAETSAASAGIAGSFALSNLAADGLAMAEADADCTTDYIEIPQGLAMAIAATATALVDGVDKFCGTLLADVTGDASATVCSAATPFKMRVVTDGGEAVDDTTDFAMGNANEFSAGAAMDAIGYWGFDLHFAQVGCA